MDKRTFRLINDQVRQRAIDHLWEAPDGYICIVQEPTRNLQMNAKFHAICHELEKLKIEWFGKPRKSAEWKVLLVSGHAIATRDEYPELIQGLEGETINIRESTAEMGKSRGSSLISYSEAFLENHRP
jgi:NinB protein